MTGSAKNAPVTVDLAVEGSRPTGISPTSASSFVQCQLKFALSYSYGWQEAGTEAQLIGNVTHKAVELLYSRVWDDRARETANALLDEAYTTEVAANQFVQLRETENPDVLRDRVLARGEESLDGLFSLEDPRHVSVGNDGLEVWVSATLYGAPIRGRIDRLYDASGAHVVADYKTGRVPSPAYSAKAWFGLYSYAAALAANDENRRLPERVELLYLAGRERLSRVVVREDALAHARRLADIWREIGIALYEGHVEARPSRLCGWCAFETACPARARRGTLPPVGSDEHNGLLAGLGLTRRGRTSTTEQRDHGADPDGADDATEAGG
jgi:putative RecB family exonuclease